MIARPNGALQPSASHEAFSWLHTNLKHDPDAQFVESTLNLCNGIAICLQLVHNSNMVRSNQDDLEPGDDEVPLLDVVDTERLMLFAQTAAQMLADDAERRIGRMNEREQKKVKK